MKKILNLAHRGFSGVYPENSPIAFYKSLEIDGLDGFESDVHLTKDGKLVIIHDPMLDRTTNGKGFVKDYTLEELKTLDIGSWKSDEFKNECVFSFEELLDLCKNSNKLLNIEIKNYEVFYEGIEQKIIDAICKEKMQDMVFISSFNHVSMQNAKKLTDEIDIGLLCEHPICNTIEYLEKLDFDAIHPKFVLLPYQKDVFDYCKANNKKIHTYTVNDEQMMRDVISFGVDSIITNFPDRLAKLL